uniref:Uncharacterized protein n=1 Tax=Oryza punctata TaxID=4537 RepID=A0A0E0M5X4_ORYPU
MAKSPEPGKMAKLWAFWAWGLFPWTWNAILRAAVHHGWPAVAQRQADVERRIGASVVEPKQDVQLEQAAKCVGDSDG